MAHWCQIYIQFPSGHMRPQIWSASLNFFFIAPSAPLSYTLSFPAITHFWSCWVFWTPRKSVSVAEKYSESSRDTAIATTQATSKIIMYLMRTIGAERWQISTNLALSARAKIALRVKCGTFKLPSDHRRPPSIWQSSFVGSEKSQSALAALIQHFSISPC